MLFLLSGICPSRKREEEENTLKSKTTAIILSVLLGQLGVDRFYLGYVGLGVV